MYFDVSIRPRCSTHSDRNARITSTLAARLAGKNDAITADANSTTPDPTKTIAPGACASLNIPCASVISANPATIPVVIPIAAIAAPSHCQICLADGLDLAAGAGAGDAAVG